MNGNLMEKRPNVQGDTGLNEKIVGIQSALLDFLVPVNQLLAKPPLFWPTAQNFLDIE